jgi:multicomponent Na+:H+ antiporter subunit C
MRISVSEIHEMHFRGNEQRLPRITMQLITSLSIGVLFAAGIFALLQRNVVRSALGMVIVSNAVNLFLLSIGAYDGVVASYAKAYGQRSDALPLALILTAIVISMGTLAAALALLRVLIVRRSTNDLEHLNELKH